MLSSLPHLGFYEAPLLTATSFHGYSRSLSSLSLTSRNTVVGVRSFGTLALFVRFLRDTKGCKGGKRDEGRRRYRRRRSGRRSGGDEGDKRVEFWKRLKATRKGRSEEEDVDDEGKPTGEDNEAATGGSRPWDPGVGVIWLLLFQLLFVSWVIGWVGSKTRLGAFRGTARNVGGVEMDSEASASQTRESVTAFTMASWDDQVRPVKINIIAGRGMFYGVTNREEIRRIPVGAVVSAGATTSRRETFSFPHVVSPTNGKSFVWRSWTILRRVNRFCAFVVWIGPLGLDGPLDGPGALWSVGGGLWFVVGLGVPSPTFWANAIGHVVAREAI